MDDVKGLHQTQATEMRFFTAVQAAISARLTITCNLPPTCPSLAHAHTLFLVYSYQRVEPPQNCDTFYFAFICAYLRSTGRAAAIKHHDDGVAMEAFGDSGAKELWASDSGVSRLFQSGRLCPSHSVLQDNYTSNLPPQRNEINTTN